MDGEQMQLSDGPTVMTAVLAFTWETSRGAVIVMMPLPIGARLESEEAIEAVLGKGAISGY
jgi:hypothetical protein